MKIAVTYDNDGTVFQHFGHTEAFKIYEVEGDTVLSSRIISSGGAGHEALAYVLKEYGVDALICGGMGAGAQSALTEAGIQVCSGATGDCDAAVASFLKGELVSSGVNCDHHHEEEEHECGSGCGGGCGGCGGGCGHHGPVFEGTNVGRTVRTHYRGTFNDGTQFDSSYDRGEPLEFVCGMGMMIPGFDKAVAEMKVGETVQVHLMPEEAYGPKDPNAIITVPVNEMPGSENLAVGEKVYLADAQGRRFAALVTACDGNTVTFDLNHEMAGKELNFEITLVSME